MSRMPTLFRLALLGSLALLATCSSGPPSSSEVPPARSADEIAERFLEARRRGDAEVLWNCLVGQSGRRRVYRGVREVGEYRMWHEFESEVDLGWANPALAPAEVWEKTGEREENGLRVMTFRQGTRSDPDRGGRIELAAQPTGSGWLVAWVDVAR